MTNDIPQPRQLVAQLHACFGHRFLGIFSKKHKAQAEEEFGELMGSKAPSDS